RAGRARWAALESRPGLTRPSALPCRGPFALGSCSWPAVSRGSSVRERSMISSCTGSYSLGPTASPPCCSAIVPPVGCPGGQGDVVRPQALGHGSFGGAAAGLVVDGKLVAVPAVLLREAVVQGRGIAAQQEPAPDAGQRL